MNPPLRGLGAKFFVKKKVEQIDSRLMRPPTLNNKFSVCTILPSVCSVHPPQVGRAIFLIQNFKVEEIVQVVKL